MEHINIEHMYFTHIYKQFCECYCCPHYLSLDSVSRVTYFDRETEILIQVTKKVTLIYHSKRTSKAKLRGEWKKLELFKEFEGRALWIQDQTSVRGCCFGLYLHSSLEKVCSADSRSRENRALEAMLLHRPLLRSRCCRDKTGTGNAAGRSGCFFLFLSANLPSGIPRWRA